MSNNMWCAVGGIQKNMVLKLKGLQSGCDTKITWTKLSDSKYNKSSLKIYFNVGFGGSKQFHRKYISRPKLFQAYVFPMPLSHILRTWAFSPSFPPSMWAPWGQKPRSHEMLCPHNLTQCLLHNTWSVKKVELNWHGSWELGMEGWFKMNRVGVIVGAKVRK